VDASDPNRSFSDAEHRKLQDGGHWPTFMRLRSSDNDSCGGGPSNHSNLPRDQIDEFDARLKERLDDFQIDLPAGMDSFRLPDVNLPDASTSEKILVVITISFCHLASE